MMRIAVTEEQNETIVCVKNGVAEKDVNHLKQCLTKIIRNKSPKKLRIDLGEMLSAETAEFPIANALCALGYEASSKHKTIEVTGLSKELYNKGQLLKMGEKIHVSPRA